MRKFSESLEEKVARLTDEPGRRLWERSVPSMVRREIALTADHLNQQRESHEQRLRQLLRLECAVGTDLLQLEQRQPRYVPYHFPEKEKLKQRLFDIEKEKRHLSLRLEERVQILENRLLELIHRHEQLDI